MRRVTQLALVLAAAIAAGSCDKVPLLAPSGSTVTLSANATTIPTGGTVGLTAFVTESGGTAVQNGTTVRFTTTLGTVSPSSVQTTNGLAVATFSAGDQSGVATVTAISGGATGTNTGTSGTGGTSSPVNTVKITIGSAAVSKISVAANPASVSPSGGSSTITATVVDANGGALPGVPVTFTSDVGAVAPTTVLSDASGQARATLTSSAQTVVTVTAGTQSATVTVTARSAPGVTISCAVASAGSGTSCASLQANANTNNVTVSFTVGKGSGSSNLTNATISFGDGSSQALGNLSGGSVTVSHIYGGPSGAATVGYTATVTGTDINGETSSASTTVTVSPRGAYSVLLEASPGDGTRPVTETFTATVSNGDAVKYEWDFNGDGTIDATTTTNKTTHVYSTGDDAGPKTVTVTATASDSRSATGRVEFNLK